METRILLFGPPAIAMGADSVTVTTPETPSCGQLIPAIGEQYPALGVYSKTARLAVNGHYGDAASRIAPGDEVALICLVSGG